MELKYIVREGKTKGIGKLLFRTLLEETESRNPEIIRVELIARESNKKAIEFYKKLGFNIEGRLENRICDKNGKLEADIPMDCIRPACKLEI
ncbi:MAG: GNAT family N-acetyltransferase [Methanosarcina sp.]|nr:GNAT family N-acetyltransferase [Methanosarcina sp.]